MPQDKQKDGDKTPAPTAAGVGDKTSFAYKTLYEAGLPDFLKPLLPNISWRNADSACGGEGG